MHKHKPGKAGDGAVLQGAMPKSSQTNYSTMGLHLRGVVTQTYVLDEPEGSGLYPSPELSDTKAIYCDVLTYGRYTRPIHRALVMQPRSGIHEGEPWIPRPADRTRDGQSFNRDRGSSAAESDGDHVIVTFLEDNFGLPLIIGAIPHPEADVGNEKRLLGHRIKPIRADQIPNIKKHRGVFWGVDKDGNYTIDLTRAHTGQYADDFSEPEPALDGSTGNLSLRLPQGSTLTLEITKGAQEGDGTDDTSESTKLKIENNTITVLNEGGAGLLLENKDADAELTIGDGAVSVAIAQHLETFWNTRVKPALDAFDAAYMAHTHLYIFGPTGPASAGTPPGAPIVMQPYDAAITSTKIKITDG